MHKNRKCFFGEILDEVMILNDTGQIAQKCWLEIPDHYPNVVLDEFIIMPNHIHDIIIINVGVNNNSPLPLCALCGEKINHREHRETRRNKLWGRYKKI
jgi:REP element-mobilizing transposase RayT